MLKNYFIYLFFFLLLSPCKSFYHFSSITSSLFTSSNNSSITSSQNIFNATYVLSPTDISLSSITPAERDGIKLKVATITWNLALDQPQPRDLAFLRMFIDNDVLVIHLQEASDKIGEKNRKSSNQSTKRFIQLLNDQTCFNRNNLELKKSWTKIIKYYTRGLLSSSQSLQPFIYHTLGPTHSIVFLSPKAQSLLVNKSSFAVPCGAGNIFPNKGGIASILTFAHPNSSHHSSQDNLKRSERYINKKFNKYKNNKKINKKIKKNEELIDIVFLNLHLAAHKEQILRREKDFQRILRILSYNSQNIWKKNYSLISSLDIKNITSCSSKYLNKKNIKKTLKLKKKLSINKKKEDNELTIENLTLSSPFSSSFSSSLSFKKNLEILLSHPLIKSPPLSSDYLALSFPYLFHHTIIAGDLNFRLNCNRKKIESFCKSSGQLFDSKKGSPLIPFKENLVINPLLSFNISTSSFSNSTDLSKSINSFLNSYDQLKKMLTHSILFNKFQEGSIMFPPSYKYNYQKSTFDSSKKKRVPSWTDRILFSSAKPPSLNSLSFLEQVSYNSIDSRASDHRPVYSTFNLYLFDPSSSSKIEDK